MFGIRPPWPFTSLEDLAIPGVSILILFLAYTSQYLFYYIEPGPLTKTEAIWFNIFVLGIWWCYDRACFVEAGPKGWVGKVIRDEGESDDEAEDRVLKKGMRWCKKCDAVKPPRAHHCRKCGRYTSPPFPSTTLLMSCGKKLHPKNGPPLPLDHKLRLAYNIPPLSPLRPIRRDQHVHSDLPPLRPCLDPLLQPQPASLPWSPNLGYGTPLRTHPCQLHHSLCTIDPFGSSNIQFSNQHNHD